MKTNVLTRNAIVAAIFTLMASQLMAQGRLTLAPGSQAACLNAQAEGRESIPLTNPEDVRRMLVDIKAELGEEQMVKIMGRSSLQTLAVYSKMDKRQIYMNAYLAAAAAGAAVAVVDFVWDKYVGNGGKKRVAVPREYFDQRPQLDRTKSFDIRPGASGPEALTPVIGSAVAGAVAYKAVEYGLHKVFGDGKIAREQLTKPREFDLEENNFRQY